MESFLNLHQLKIMELKKLLLTAFLSIIFAGCNQSTQKTSSTDYGPTGNKFNGIINWVQIEIGEDDHNHLVTAEDKVNMAMAKQ